jgi:hypothetical protein
VEGISIWELVDGGGRGGIPKIKTNRNVKER